jgi:hypothetical protein
MSTSINIQKLTCPSHDFKWTPRVYPFRPVLLLPVYICQKHAKISQLARVGAEALINKVLEETAKEKLKKLDNQQKPLPSVVATVKGCRREV